MKQLIAIINDGNTGNIENETYLFLQAGFINDDELQTLTPKSKNNEVVFYDSIENENKLPKIAFNEITISIELPAINISITEAINKICTLFNIKHIII